jgi:acetyltransferase-like isoleucine patch superfamily enzyme
MYFLKSFKFKKKLKQAFHYKDKESFFYLGKNVVGEIADSSQINLEGNMFFGFFAKPNQTIQSHKPQTVIRMAKNSKLNILGNVYIRPGVTLIIGANAELTFYGENTIGPDCFIMCNYKMEFHKNVELSWGVTAIDEDFHYFQTDKGVKVTQPRAMIFSENSGVMSQVLIPKGVIIGKNSVIGGHTVLRQNVENNCLVYSHSEIKIKHNVSKPYAKN